MDNHDDSLFIVIPAYNEEENIVEVIEEWYKVIENHQTENKDSKLVIINDGSTDNTLAVARNAVKKKECCVVLDKPNSGHASSCIYGYKYSIKNGAKYIFQTDSDRQTNPNEFERFWENRANDVIMGYRKQRGDGLGRLVISRILSIVNLFCFRIWVKDANVPYRLMSREALINAIRYVPKSHILGNAILTVVFEKIGYKIMWIPISFVPRNGGVSMYNITKFFKIGLYSVFDFCRLNREINQRIEIFNSGHN